MKRIIPIVLFAFMTVVLFAGCSSDTASRQDSTTASKDSAAVSTTSKPTSQLKIGAAKVAIGYPDNFFPYTSFRGRYFTGIHDDLYARVIMLSNDTDAALLLSIDNGDLSGEWLPRISELSGIPESNIYLTATHTHEAPYINRTYPETTVKDVEKSKEYAAYAWNALSEAIQTAKKNMQPGEIGIGSGTCNVNVNRNYKYTGNQPEITAPYITAPNPEGVCDPTVAVMKFEDMSGNTIAYAFAYSVHSTVMFQSRVKDNGMLVSADLAGSASRYVEKLDGDKTVAMFLLAPAGDTMPRYTSAYSVFDAEGNMTQVDSGTAGYTLLDVQGQALGSEVFRVASNMDTFESSVSIQGITKTISVPGQEKWDENPATLPVNYTYKDSDPVSLRLGLILINDTALIGFPGELVTNVGTELKDTFTGLNCKHAIVVSQCDGSNGYFSDDEGYADMHFDAIASYAKPGYDKLVISAEKEMYSALQSK